MRKTLSSLVAALCFVGLLPFVGSAQSQTVTLTCADFVRNPNGTWSPVHPVQIGPVTMGPGVSFSPGVQFGGIDLASILNKQCP